MIHGYFLVGLNDVGTWGIMEVWNGEPPQGSAPYRGPFNSKQEAIHREEVIAARFGWSLMQVVRTDGEEELPPVGQGPWVV